MSKVKVVTPHGEVIVKCKTYYISKKGNLYLYTKGTNTAAIFKDWLYWVSMEK